MPEKGRLRKTNGIRTYFQNKLRIQDAKIYIVTHTDKQAKKNTKKILIRKMNTKIFQHVKICI